MCKHLTLFPITRKEDATSQKALAAVISSALRRAAIDGRNLDGTGIGYINGNGFVVYKTGTNAVWHTNTDEFADTLLGINLTAQPIIGHVRSASTSFQSTKDKATDKFPDKDAHPFVVGTIMLAHNGTISNHKDLVAELKLDGESIDSYAIAEMLAREKELSVANLNNVTKQLQGSFALIFQHLAQPQQVYIGRHGKPLDIVKVYSHDSPDDLELLFVTTEGNNVKDAILSVQHVNRYMLGRNLWGKIGLDRLDENMWYLLDHGEMQKEGGSLLELGKMEWKKVATRTTTYVTNRAVNPVVWPGYNIGTIKNKGIEIEAMIYPVLKILPLTVEEFRYFYTMLNQVEPTAPMERDAVAYTVKYLKYLIADKERLAYLEQFLDMDFILMSDDTFQITRRSAVPRIEWQQEPLWRDDNSTDTTDFVL